MKLTERMACLAAAVAEMRSVAADLREPTTVTLLLSQQDLAKKLEEEAAVVEALAWRVSRLGQREAK